MTAWKWARASCAGLSHLLSGIPREDACTSGVFADGRIFAAVVADGAGAAPYGRSGAVIVCRVISTALRRHFAGNDTLPSAEDLDNWIDLVRHHISVVAWRKGVAMQEFAATLVLAVSDGDNAVFVHIGDGGTAFRRAGQWLTPTWPNHGEYASSTFFVTDDKMPPVRICAISSADIEVVALFTDGLERLALDFRTGKPHPGFFDAMAYPLDLVDEKGRQKPLCEQLHQFLDSDRVNSRTDDDKTLVLACRM